MKIIILIFFILTIGCSLHTPILLKSGSTYTIKQNGKSFFSLSVPEGSWSISPVSLSTIDRGWFDIDGVPTDSYFGYSVNFTIDSVDGVKKILKDVVPALRTHDFNAYLNRELTRFTPERQLEQNAKNLGGRVLVFKGYSCKNTWFEWLIAPQLNEGRGIAIYRSFITCPLVIDGKIYRFNIGIDSSVRPEFYTQKAKYDRNKRPEDPEINIDTDELLKTLGDRVIVLFKDLKFYGKVSQDYKDVLEKCDPSADDQC